MAKLVSYDITETTKGFAPGPPTTTLLDAPAVNDHDEELPQEQHALFPVGVAGGSRRRQWRCEGRTRRCRSMGRSQIVVARRSREEAGPGRSPSPTVPATTVAERPCESRGIHRMGFGNWDAYIIRWRRHGDFRPHNTLLPLGCAVIRDVFGFSDGRPSS